MSSRGCVAPAAIAAAGRLRRPLPAARRPAAAPCRHTPMTACTQLQSSTSVHRRHRTCAAAGGAGTGTTAEEEEEEEEEEDEPTEAELEEARKALQDFMEGMGASGLVDRPEDIGLPEDRMTYQEVLQLMGMSGWRVGDQVCPTIQELVIQIEGCLRSILPEDQGGVYPLDERFKFLDSLDPEGEDVFSFRSMRDPPRDHPGYPRLQIENRAYYSRAFRKVHLEVAVRQDGLQIFHCVMYPNLDFDLPILSMDVVANNGRVSLAIIDPCPTSPNLQLPPVFESSVKQLQARYQLDSNRGIPEWGQAIFSPYCLIVRPESSEDMGSFLKYACALTRVHVELAKIAHPVSRNQQRRLELQHAGHKRFCEKHLENDKTRRVLAAAFGEPLADQYMQECMFDCPPPLSNEPAA